MRTIRQDIRFTRSGDGTRIAFATAGDGYPLLKAGHWLGHLEYDWQTPVWQPWISGLAARYRLVRFDSRGCGLSDRDVDDLSLDALVADMEAVADAAGLERFALLGPSQGGAISVAYAARHPERVSHLVLVGAFARGPLRTDASPSRRAAVEAMIQLIEHGWGEANSAYLQLFTSQFFPDASREQRDAFNAVQRSATSPRMAARLAHAFAELDAAAHLAQVRCPTLVLHCRGDARVPFDEGRYIAARIPDARLEPLDSRNHFPLAGHAAFDHMLEAIAAFLPGGTVRTAAELSLLTSRERQILELIARGLDNAQIAARLNLSEKTVRNNITPIFAKLQVENRPQAIVRARDAGLGR
jgi:pimeloyl-ACP methyl ester carboxylesterase/DNA-binding CsgD family transcriptional regulator